VKSLVLQLAVWVSCFLVASDSRRLQTDRLNAAPDVTDRAKLFMVFVSCPLAADLCCFFFGGFVRELRG
jgi:hypothetical protein